MTSRRAKRKDERRARRRAQADAPSLREGFLARISTDWIVAGIILAVVVVAAGIFTSRQVFRGGGGATPVGEISLVHSLAVDPSDPRTLFLGEGKGLYRSTDGGRKWRRLEVNEPVRKVQIDPANPKTLLVTAGTTLRKSADGGETWQNLATGLPAGLFAALGSDPADPSKMYVYLSGHGLYRSDDGGASWALQNAVPNSQITSLAVKPGVPDTIYAFDNADGLVLSTDGGKRFVRIEGAIPRTRVTDILTFAQQPETIFAAAGAGAYKSADGGRTWTPALSGLDGVDIKALARDSKTGHLYAVDFRGVVYLSADSGESWARSAA